MAKSKTLPPPDWLPNWKDSSQYPDPKTTPKEMWAWEFLRRSQKYQRFWEEQVVPHYMRTRDQVADEVYLYRTTCLLMTIKDQFGLVIKSLIPPSLSSLDRPPISFDGIGFHRYDVPPHIRKESAPDYSCEIELKKTELAVIFDLEKPIEPQLRAAKRGLECESQHRIKSGELQLTAKRTTIDKYQTYLRVLDATALGASYGEILCELGFGSTVQTKQTVRDTLARAERLRDSDYRFIPL